MPDLLSVPEAARVLGLSQDRVRAMAAHGQLAASKIGDRWLIERGAVEERSAKRVPAGRPFAPHNAWALLLLASGVDVKGLDPSVRSRLRRALAVEGLENLAPRLKSRANPQYFDAHAGEISYLLEDPLLVRSGVSAAGAHGLDLVSGREVDSYLSARKLEKVVANHALAPAGQEGNVRLRLVPNHVWRLMPKAQIAPIAAVALDLFEDRDPRSASVGRAALKDLDRAAADAFQQNQRR
jgi:excisionase family DNA binding protein